MTFAEEATVYAESHTPSIALAITQGDPYQETPATAGEIAYRSNSLKVSGNYVAYYALLLNAGLGSTGELKGKNNPDAIISKVPTETRPEDFANNTWGYGVTTVNKTDAADSSLVYNPVPEAQPAPSATLGISNTLRPTVNDSYKVVFAAKFGADAPADHYQTKISISLIGNAATTAEIGFTASGITINSMQSMTKEICNNAPENTTGLLTDARDNKFYWVAKLKDGNCWMTQNIDYDGGGTKIGINSWPNNGGKSVRYYHDPGNYIYKGPDSTTECTVTGGNISQCSNIIPLSAFMSMDDLHYHIGNYYSWGAAVNGATTNTTGNVQGICPAGWVLPIGGNTLHGTDSPLYNLLDTYGIGRSLTNGIYGIYKEPLYLTYSGYIATNALRSIGKTGRLWLSLSANSNTYPLEFDTSVDTASGANAEYAGYPVRCLFKTN